MDYSDCEAMSCISDTDSWSNEIEKDATEPDSLLSVLDNTDDEVPIQNAGKVNMAKTNVPQFEEIEIPEKYLPPQKVKITADDTVCVFSDSSQLLYMIPKEGDPYEFKIDVKILDLACHPSENEMYCIALHDTDIREVNAYVKNGKTVKLGLEIFQICPTCLAMGKDGELIVGRSNTTTTTKDNYIHIYYKDEGNRWIRKIQKDLNFTPLSIIVCKTSSGVILFFGKNGIMISENLTLTTSSYYDRQSVPCPSVDGAVDSKGNILIATSYKHKTCVFDHYNNKILKYLTIPTDGWLTSLCQDNDGNCYAGAVFSNKIIKIKF